MTKTLTASAVLLLSTAPLYAGGIERSTQTIAPLFEAGNYAEFNFGFIRPTIEGTDNAPAAIGGPFDTGNVTGRYNSWAMAYKHQFTPNFSAMIQFDQPFGADIEYPLVTEGGSALLGGTQAHVDATNITGAMRYTMDNGFGVHGGIRASRANADVTLAGAAFGPLDGYKAVMDQSGAYGWLAGASYERPDIALRASITYNSPITHKFKTTETFGAGIAGMLGLPAGMGIPTGETEVTTPRSVNIDLQTGVMEDTLAFGSIRWVKWSEFMVKPPVYSKIPGQGDGLVTLENSTTYTIGMGRKFTDQWSGAASVSWEGKGDDLVSPLAPSNGRVGMTLAAIYTMDNIKITTGVNYTKLGDAQPETDGQARAQMSGNSGVGFGIKVGLTF